jgi:hypothetical protein
MLEFEWITNDLFFRLSIIKLLSILTLKCYIYSDCSINVFSNIEIILKVEIFVLIFLLSLSFTFVFLLLFFFHYFLLSYILSLKKLWLDSCNLSSSQIVRNMKRYTMVSHIKKLPITIGTSFSFSVERSN